MNDDNKHTENQYPFSPDDRLPGNRDKPEQTSKRKRFAIATGYSLLLHIALFAALLYMLYPFIVAGMQQTARQPDTVKVKLVRSIKDYMKEQAAVSKATSDNDKTKAAASPEKNTAPTHKENQPNQQPAVKKNNQSRKIKPTKKLVKKTKPQRKIKRSTKQRNKQSKKQLVANQPPRQATVAMVTSAGENKQAVTRPPVYGIGSQANPYPPYPAEARVYGWEGRMRLRVWVTANGRTNKIMIEKSTGYAVLDHAAVKTVKHWQFQPALDNGIRVAGQTTVPIHFKLTN